MTNIRHAKSPMRSAAWILASLCAVAEFSSHSAAQGAGARPATPLEVIPAILDAFRTHRIVSYPGGHTDGNEGQAQLRALIDLPAAEAERVKRACHVK